jgi:hypothetical protein
MTPRGWIDVTGDMLRDAAKVAADIDPHDAHELRLEALSNGPGPDPGFCPTCGAWRKAGMLHTCDPKRIEENERFAEWIAWRAMQP